MTTYLAGEDPSRPRTDGGRGLRILIAGAGATGGFFGLRLAQAGRDVSFLVRPRRAEVLRQRGLRLTGLGQSERIEPRLVTADGIGQPYDVVLLSVKATALPQVLDDLAPAVGPQTRIIPFLNGMAHLGELSARFGTAAVLCGVVKVATQLSAGGDIVQLAPLASLETGTQDGQPDVRLEQLAAELSGAGFEFSVTNAGLAAMWHKWVLIATVGALTCLMRSPVGDIVACPGGPELGPAILAEAAAVSAAAGYPVPAAELAAITDLVTAAGSGFASSMFRDVSDGAGTEVEHILGDLAGRGRQAGVSTPLLDLATLHLRVYERRRAARPGPVLSEAGSAAAAAS